jgi:hypothetical protein
MRCPVYKFLRIESDPTMWVLHDPVDVAQLTAPDQPLAVRVAHPLAVLCPASAAGGGVT